MKPESESLFRSEPQKQQETDAVIDNKDHKLNAAELEIEHAVFEGLAFGDYAVMVTDHTKPDEPIVYVNDAFEDLTGYKLAELIGLHPPFLQSVRGNQSAIKQIEDAIRAGEACSAILQDCKKDQTTGWYQLCLTPIFSNGRLTHFFGSLKDVTMQVEEASSDKARDEFLATLAHELKTPMVGAERMFALIAEGVLGSMNDELRNTIVLLSNGNRKALNLVTNLLEGYRLGGGAELLHPSTCDLPALMRTTAHEVEATMPQGSLRIDVLTSNNFPPCVLDHLAISRLLTNLLENAVKFSSVGGKVQMNAECSGEEITIKVTDTGVGIPREEIKNIFDKGKRAKSDRYTPGCGIGLHICKTIVDAHKGRILVESAVGLGSTFVVKLPFIPAS